MSLPYWRVRALIRPQALAHNLQRVRDYAPQSQVIAVIKANAYGHDPALLAQALETAERVAVINLDEALSLREVGYAQPVLLLQGANSEQEIAAAVDCGFELVISSMAQLELFCAYGQQHQAMPNFWLKLDSGMHRLGLAPQQLAAAQQLLTKADLPAPYNVMTHFACADESGPHTERQCQSFQQALTNLPAAEQSLANSAAIIAYPQSHADSVRPGIMLYGASPFANRTAAELNLKPVMSLQARVLTLQQLKAGDSLGYGHTWQAPTECEVAVISAGYADGVPRNLPAGVPVAIGDSVGSSVARVSMDSCYALLAADHNVEVGDIATLWGQHENGQVLPADDVAQACGSIAYELFTRVSARVPRIAVGDWGG